MAYTLEDLFAQTADDTVANTVDETTLVSTGQGSVTIPANTFSVGKSFIFLMSGFHSATGNPNITIKVKLNSTVIATTGVVSSGNGTNNYFEVRANLTCRTTGSSGTISCQGYYTESGGGGNGFSMVNTSPVTVDTTIDQDVDITVTWGTADSGNTITATNFTIRKLT